MKYLLILISLLIATNTFSKEENQFTDPIDGKFDVSNWLLDNMVGFFPIPLVLTEPAIGYGGGASLLFFKPQVDENGKRDKTKKPDTFALFGAGTETKSWFGGGGYRLLFNEDKIRYSGFAMKGDFNLKYYGNNNLLPGGNFLNYSVETKGFSQKLDFRLPDSNFFLGASYLFFSNETSFSQFPTNEIKESDLDLKNAFITPTLTYDDRDSDFTTDSGFYSTIKFEVHHDILGSTVNYNQLNFFLTNYIPMNKGKTVLGTFISTKNLVGGEAPFYAKPNVILRGVPINKYLGDYSFSTEIEVRHDIVPRWSVLGFIGGGSVYNEFNNFFKTTSVVSYGGGFRYLMARLLKARAGVDIASSDDGDIAVYLQFGSAWRDF
jgi:hypothetical protein